MKKTSLQGVLNRPALCVSKPDEFWPIPDQFVGVEIELEGQSNKEVAAHRNNGRPFWAEHEDGSLRGGIEYVLAQPTMGNTLREAIHYFFRNFKTFTESPRTSIHVHLNMLQENETIEGLKNMVVLYYMFENAFFTIADENRKWNGYCNPFEDNPPEVMATILGVPDVEELRGSLAVSAGRNTNRYYGLNINSLQKYGTLEFRHLPLVRDEERLFSWIKLLMELKKAANIMADEGTSPEELFKTPDDLGLLEKYMPLFGHTLLGIVGTGEAFVRLSAVVTLGVREARRHGRVGNNKAFARFQKVQMEEGRSVSQKPKRATSKKNLDAVFDEIVGQAGLARGRVDVGEVAAPRGRPVRLRMQPGPAMPGGFLQADEVNLGPGEDDLVPLMQPPQAGALIWQAEREELVRQQDQAFIERVRQLGVRPNRPR